MVSSPALVLLLVLLVSSCFLSATTSPDTGTGTTCVGSIKFVGADNSQVGESVSGHRNRLRGVSQVHRIIRDGNCCFKVR